MYFDAEGIVQQVDFQDRDAEELCRDLTLTEISYQEALNRLVAQLAAQDMIEGRDGSFEILLPEDEFTRRTYWAQEAAKVWSEALDKSNVNCNVFFAISMMP